jgi:hypothetical protein
VRQPNGSWTGIMGELTARRANMSLFPLTLTATRAQDIAVTTPYMDEGYAMVIQTRELNSGYNFLLPFQGSAWAVIIAALLFTVAMLMLLDSRTRLARLRAIERVEGRQRAKHKHRRNKMMQHLLETIMCGLFCLFVCVMCV